MPMLQLGITVCRHSAHT